MGDEAGGRKEYEGVTSTLYLGRSVRIVGPQKPVDPETLPHEMLERGLLGKNLHNWWFNTKSKDPFSRMFIADRARDLNNGLNWIIRNAPEGTVNPKREEVRDPAAMSRQIKDVARFFGADLVGIAPTDPAYLHTRRVKAGFRRSTVLEPDSADPRKGMQNVQDMARTLPHAICCAVAWDYDLGLAHRHRIGDAAFGLIAQKAMVMYFNIAAYIRELGYEAVRGAANPLPLAMAAGLGELGRNGLLVTEKFGSRVHLISVVLTDLPLVADKPVDIGVEDFCKLCKKCARTCPTNSIPHGGKTVHNGVEKYQIKWKTCFSMRPAAHDWWEDCLTCVASCPYTKRDTWWHSLAIWSVKTCPIPLRPLVIKPLTWVDDLIWGKVPKRRVKWLAYDSGKPPGEKECTVAGCTAHQEDSKKPKRGKANRGYYPPLRENANRF